MTAAQGSEPIGPAPVPPTDRHPCQHSIGADLAAVCRTAAAPFEGPSR